MTATPAPGSFRQEAFDNGIVLEFFDQSNRYFGDYHRLRVLVEIRLPLTPTLFLQEPDPAAARDRAAALVGEVLVETRVLERMGVPGAEVEAVQSRLVEDFLASAGLYLGRPDFPARLLAGRLTPAGGRRLPGTPYQ